MRRTALRPGSRLTSRTELSPGKPLRRVEPGGLKAGRARGKVAAASGRQKAQTRKDTIPPAVRRLVNARDQWCVRCGSPDSLEMHHRRLKGQGGDPRPHTDCPCNLVRLHAECHQDVHQGDRREAEDDGYILPAETTEPGMHPVAVATADGGLTAWPTCGGAWIFEAPAEAS